MSDEKDQSDPLIDGFPKSIWVAVDRALDPKGDFGAVQAVITAKLTEASGKVFGDSDDPEKQFALHQNLGFLKFANMLVDLRDRARFVSERGVSPSAASRETPL